MNCNYTYVGPALLVLPLLLCSIVNLFVAGPPLKTVVLDSAGASYGASLPFMKLRVQDSMAKFNLWPEDEMTHFFVITCSAPPAATTKLHLQAQVHGKRTGSKAIKLASASTTDSAAPSDAHALQLMQPLLGHEEYSITILSRSGDRSDAPKVPLPQLEFRLTYVPTQFTRTQIGVRSFYIFTSLCMLVAYTAAMCRTKIELGQRWMTALLLLLVALNDPLYIMRVVLGGNQTMYNVSVLAQIAFSGGLFLFCLAYADGLNRTGGERPICTFYLPKLVLVSAYVLSAAAVFVLHGRVPDRISVSEGAGGEQQLLVLIGSLTASLLGVGAWLSFLVARAVYRLGWKKVEYIYTEREKSFVGITMVFFILWLCGHLYRAVHGRRGSWMQLQLPFLTLTNSYLALLTHAFWPGGENLGEVRPAEGGYEAERDYDEGKQQGLLDEDEE